MKTVEKKEVWVAEYYLISIVIRWLYGSSINWEDVLKLFLLQVVYGCFLEIIPLMGGVEDLILPNIFLI